MNLVLQTTIIEDYLKATDIIDYNESLIKSVVTEISRGVDTEIDLVQRVYEFVRDKIFHSCDLDNGQVVTCKASEVLANKHGLCYAKSHLLAALLRNLEVPTGFCYQKLALNDQPRARFVLHGLNAVYLQTINKWIRVDARGNNKGINAQFSIETEKLAYQTRSEYVEVDESVIYSAPSNNIIRVLNAGKNFHELIDSLPSEIILIDIEKPHLYPHNDICALLAYSANGADVDTTIVNGQVVMENRKLLNMNEREVLRKAHECASRITGQTVDFI